jgi:hypothetical protein
MRPRAESAQTRGSTLVDASWASGGCQRAGSRRAPGGAHDDARRGGPIRSLRGGRRPGDRGPRATIRAAASGRLLGLLRLLAGRSDVRQAARMTVSARGRMGESPPGVTAGRWAEPVLPLRPGVGYSYLRATASPCRAAAPPARCRRTDPIPPGPGCWNRRS